MAAPGRSNKLHATPTAPSLVPRWATVQEAADYLRVTKRTIRQMRADGRIRGYRSGTRLVRFELNELDAAMGYGNGNGAA